MEKMRVTITGVAVGSLVITVRCVSLQILEEFWKDYFSGHLGDVVQNCFVTEEILKELNLTELKLKTTMEEEEYKACRAYFEKDKGTFPLKPHLVDSTGEMLEHKMELLKLQRITGSLPKPLLVSSVSEGNQKQQQSKQLEQEMEIMESERSTGKKKKRPPPLKLHDVQPVEFSKVYPLPTTYPFITPPRNLSEETTGTITVDGKVFDNADDLKEIKQLGHGSYSSVYKMIHEPTGYIMAVKRIALLEGIRPREQRKLLMDLECSLRVNDCPHTVHVYGVLFKEGHILICMELMKTSLDKFYKKVCATPGRRIPQEVLQEIAINVVHALNYIHGTLHIIHRDVKPSNILVDDSGNFKLSDFGISGQLIDSLESVKGYKCYMAPERLGGDGYMEGYYTVSDIWSLGITMVELATGEYPYPQCETTFEQFDYIMYGPSPTLPEGGPYSEEFRDFVAQCLQKDYQKRPNCVLLMEHDFLNGNGTDSGFDTKSWITRILQELEQS